MLPTVDQLRDHVNRKPHAEHERSEIMNEHAGFAGLVCQASIAPPGVQCAYGTCQATATVRLMLRHGHPPYDYCEVDWPRVTDTLRTRGQTVTDTTGDMWTVRAEFANWEIWQSKSSGVYYALTSFGGRGVSVHAYLAGTLRAGMRAAEQNRTSAETPATGPMTPQPHAVAGVTTR